LEGETVTEQVLDPKTNEGVSAGAKLYAGKYKTPEEMEDAIKAKDNESHKLFEKNKQLQQTLEQSNVAPEHYDLPGGSTAISDELDGIISMAKAASLSQEKFEKLVNERVSAKTNFITQLETAKKELGEPTMNLLTDYVKKNYPENVHETLINGYILNPAARKEALAHREKLLSSRTPGM
jgi:hypothetical protein